uniref:Transmembrane protein 25 n=1 Tax=Latimeria chalumnae TaxID=7897 RepID=H3BFD3_LATCH
INYPPPSLSLSNIYIHTYLICQVASFPGSGEPAPKINGRSTTVATLEENSTKDFTCQTEGWKSAPSLTWYLNGKKQKVNETGIIATTGEVFNRSTSTFTVTAHRTDRELNCSVIDPATGKVENATVILNVQFMPEIVKMDVHYQERKEPGLFLVMFVLVKANPPANITWVDDDGRLVTNTSDFMILDTKSYPWLTNHTVHVQLTSVTRNFSFTAGNSMGVINSSIASPGFLHSHIEVPVLGIIVGGVLAFLTILVLNVIVFCTIYRRKRKMQVFARFPFFCPSESINIKFDEIRLPRENMSLPSNLQLNDLNRPSKEVGGDVRKQFGHREEEDDFSEQESSSAFGNRGFVRFPMVGYIYKVSSMSSDEIWL